VAADRRAWRFSKRPKRSALDINPELRVIVSEKLRLHWSPEQVSGWLKRHYPALTSMQISHETIYKTVYVRSRKTLDHQLARYFRRAHKMRHGKRHSRSGDRGTISIVNGVSIHQRDKTVDARLALGHWEGDLVTGSGNTHIATLVERKTRYTLLLKVAGKDADSVNNALIRAFKKMPIPLRKSLTWDRGMELAKHVELSRRTKVPVYFCDPQSPWQRGTNENTNSLVRQYFPKKTCLAQHSQAVLDETAKQLNERPRKTLSYMTPHEALNMPVALTG
jgi:IS30 family transposase